MPFPVTTTADLKGHIAALGVRAGQDIVVHSRLLSFGRLEGGAAAVYEALRDAVGAQGTIAVPTYTFDKQGPYDRARTPSEGMGVLSEYVRVLPDAIRSRCPIHNHAAVGARASVLDTIPGTGSLGPGSDFDALASAGFRLVLLGAAFSEGATFLHHLEAVAGVPYRRWITLERRRVNDNGVVEPVQCRYYTREEAGWREDFDATAAALTGSGLLTSVPCVLGKSHHVALAELQTAVLARLAKDPYALVKRQEAAGA